MMKVITKTKEKTPTKMMVMNLLLLRIVLAQYNPLLTFKQFVKTTELAQVGYFSSKIAHLG